MFRKMQEYNKKSQFYSGFFLFRNMLRNRYANYFVTGVGIEMLRIVLAVIVVPDIVPRTRTLSPSLMSERVIDFHVLSSTRVVCDVLTVNVLFPLVIAKESAEIALTTPGIVLL